VNVFLACGLIFILALGASKLLGRIKFPAVTSYLLLGILIGPYGLNLISKSLVNATDSIGYFVLGLVAFSLGQNFLWRELKHVGKTVISISCFAAFGAIALVTLGLLLIKRPVSEAIVLGGIAAATAPMATIMIVREYRAKGPFTRMLLGIVAIDDAWGIIAFAGAMVAAKLISLPATENVFASAMIGTGKEITGALVLGTILGSLLSMLSRYSKIQMDSFIFSIGFILINTGTSLKLGISPLLANMAMGVAVVNLTKRHIFFDVLKRIDWPFYLLFFVLCGASLQIPFLRKLGVIGTVYVAARTLGKYGGAYLGGQIVHAEEKIKKYLGLGLIPQAGVALGLAIVAKAELPHCGDLIFTTTVATTIVFESIGPFCTKFAITKAGEVRAR
jgi:Kef-type K+ transport system membrane component KefB